MKGVRGVQAAAGHAVVGEAAPQLLDGLDGTRDHAAVGLVLGRPRVATSAGASASVMTPARQAATSSPRLWPSMAAGCTPQDIQRRARAYSQAKSAGWVTAVRPRAR